MNDSSASPVFSTAEPLSPRPAAGASADHGGPAANARLTALAGASLFVLLAVLGLTIPGVRRHLGAHIFVGFLVVGPLLLKLCSTGYRFMRYYTGDRRYGQAGPPRPLLRILAPFVVLSTVTVFASGIALVLTRPGSSSLLVTLHKASFLLWFALMTVHVLAYLAKTATLVSADLTGRGPVAVLAARRVRLLLIAASLLAGLILALATRGLAHPWVSWFASHQRFDH